MPEAQRIERLTVAEYLAGERRSDVRHEYIDGELFAMVGASRAHNLLATNFSRALGNALEGTPCRVTVSDMKVRIPTTTRFYYPDVMVSCSDVQEEPDDHFETRPEVIVEVLSTSTEVIDRREKRLAYATIESLREYVLVAQHEVAVELYRRTDEGWYCLRLKRGDALELGLAGGIEIPVETLYERVPLDS